MWLIDQLAESRIEEAMRAGDFDDLPGQGGRIPVETDALVPEELRTAYRLLKNAGFAPPEVSLLRQISEVESLLAGIDCGEMRGRAIKRLNLLRAQLGTRGHGFDPPGPYAREIIDRLDRE